MCQKLWGLLVCGQLWILYSKINFKVFYFIQFSIFFEKDKIIGCRLFIMTLQLLGLAFLNSITKFLIILYFESFSTSFYFFSYMLYNSKWFENFQACDQLVLKNESEEPPPFWTFFIQMWACEVQLLSFLQGPKKIVVNSKAHIFQSTRWRFLKFFPHVLKSAYYKIPWLHVSKNVFFSKIW